jgi:hypothetical protein
VSFVPLPIPLLYFSIVLSSHLFLSFIPFVRLSSSNISSVFSFHPFCSFVPLTFLPLPFFLPPSFLCFKIVYLNTTNSLLYLQKSVIKTHVLSNDTSRATINVISLAPRVIRPLWVQTNMHSLLRSRIQRREVRSSGRLASTFLSLPYHFLHWSESLGDKPHILLQIFILDSWRAIIIFRRDN